MTRVLALLILFVIPGSSEPADERAALRPCADTKPVPSPPGAVVRLFELRKDRNPENVLVVHTYVDPACRFVADVKDKARLLDMYWRMDAGSPSECYKPTHSKIKSETRKAVTVKALSPDKTRAEVDISRQLDRFEHDLLPREAEVVLVRSPSGCSAEARLKLATGAVLRVREVGGKGKQAFGMRFLGVAEVEFKGEDAAGKPVRRVYRVK